MESKILKNKTTSLYCLSIGVFTIVVWTYLLITDNLPCTYNSLPAYILRWFTEFSGGIFLIVAGISIYKRYSMRRTWLFIALGFNIGSSLYSFTGYFINFEIKSFVFTTILFILSLLIAGWNYRYWKDIIFTALSLGIYSSINILAISFGDIKMDILLLSSPLIIALILALITFYNITYYKENIENQPNP